MSRPDGPLLVLGVGNILLGDEGVGVRVAEQLLAEASSLPRDAQVVDGGTLGLDLLPLLDGARAAVIVDAVDLRALPGTVAVLRDAEIGAALGGHLSPHQVGVGDLLAAARLMGVLPENVSLVGIQPAAIEIGLELSEAVEDAVPRAVAAVQAEIELLDSALAPAIA